MRSKKINIRFFDALINHLVSYPVPVNLYYIWGVGSLLGILLVIQVATGVLLAMHYTPHIDFAFSSVERIMREIPSGWMLRYLHSNGASFIFILIYAHIARGFYFQSFQKPKQWVWCSGVLLFILMAGVAFLGYTLPWGQMSFWGTTVITNLLTAIPLFGQKIVVWIWGGFSINVNTLNRFFSLHYFLSIIILLLSGVHLMLLHFVGSSTPNCNDPDFDYLKFSPYFAIKDMASLIWFVLIYFLVVFFKPNMFGHPDNYIRADALVTPAHIVPEWYFLPFYAMLKAFPSKSAGALAMLLSMVLLFIIPWLNSSSFGINSIIADGNYRLFAVSLFQAHITNMLVLGWLGGLAANEINQLWMQVCTAFYFIYILLSASILSLADMKFLLHLSRLSTKCAFINTKWCKKIQLMLNLQIISTWKKKIYLFFSNPGSTTCPASPRPNTPLIVELFQSIRHIASRASWKPMTLANIQKRVLSFAFPWAEDGSLSWLLIVLLLLVVTVGAYVFAGYFVGVLEYYCHKMLFFVFFCGLVSQGEQDLLDNMEQMAAQNTPLLKSSPAAAVKIESEFLLPALVKRVARLTALHGGVFPYPGNIPKTDPEGPYPDRYSLLWYGSLSQKIIWKIREESLELSIRIITNRLRYLWVSETEINLAISIGQTVGLRLRG